MAAATAVPLTNKQQATFIAYYTSVQSLQNVKRDNTRARLIHIDKQYQRELDNTEENRRAKAANKAGDPSRLQNVTVPVIMPQVEAALVHQSSVFLTGHPLLGVVASPAYMDEAIQLETVIDNNAVRGGWVRELLMGFRDGFKYNTGFFEVSWKEDITYEVNTDIQKSLKTGIPKKVIWSGNSVTRLDPYNTFVDTRVPVTEVYKDGEFAGYTKFYSRIRLKTLMASLPDLITSNIKKAFESGLGSLSVRDSGAMYYFTPGINAEVTDEGIESSGTNWLAWAGLDKQTGNKIEYKDGYEVTTLYCRVLPEEFGLQVPNKDVPQIYKLLIVNHEHIIYAELQTNAHSYLPILAVQPLEDGLNYQTKSLAENGSEFQALATGFLTSIIASRRRAISDRVLYDPSRVTSANMNSSNPSAKIPVRPSAYGKKLSDAVYAFPYNEDQSSSSMQQVQVVLGMANSLNGQNQAQQGQFVKGNRTLEEFDSVMANANGRDQLASILIEHQFFVPMKLILKLNTLQYQGGTTVYNRDKDIEVEIDPIKLRKAVIEFKISDGLIPSSKILSTDTLGVALQVLGSSPQIAAGYNVAPLFSYFMKSQGAKITEFEKSAEQVAYESAMDQWTGLAQIAIEKGVDPSKLPPQPLPEQFNYDPRANKPAPKDATSKEES